MISDARIQILLGDTKYPKTLGQIIERLASAETALGRIYDQPNTMLNPDDTSDEHQECWEYARAHFASIEGEE